MQTEIENLFLTRNEINNKMKPSLLWIIASIVFHSVSADYGEFPLFFYFPP